MKRVAAFGIALWSVIAVAGLLCGCSGGSGPDTGPQRLNIAPPAADPLGLPVPAELARLAELPTPDGADPAVFAALKSELADMLRKRGDDRIVSAPPMLPASSAYLSWDSDSSTLNWGYKCTGDYNQDSLVGVNDITPLGQNYLAEVPGDPNSMLAVVDGNGDGLITVNDITQIGQNYGARVTAYNVYSSSALSDYPSEAASGNGGAALLGSVPFPEGPPPAGERRRFSFAVDDPQPETYFWVRPTDGSSEGTPSSYYHLPTPLNQPPVASLTAELTVCDIGEPVEFDASLSTDPDGEIVKYEWDWDGMQNGWEWYDSGTTATVEHSFEQVGTFGTVVRVTDDAGATGTAGVEIIVTPAGLDPPVAVLTAEPTSGAAPLAVSFSAEGSYDIDGTIEDYEWDLDGDGDYNEPGDELNAKGSATAYFTYTEDGQYTACVRVTDNDGASDTASVTSSIGTPTAQLVADPTSGAPPLLVNFDASGSSSPVGDIVKYEWDWDGDGNWDEDTGNTPTTSHEYEEGNYTASVKVTDELGGQDTASVSISSAVPVIWPMYGHDARHTCQSPYVGAQTNNVKWSYTTGDGVVSAPSIDADGAILFGGVDGKIYALNPDGSLKWSYSTGFLAVTDSPAIGADGTVYAGTYAGMLYALNPDGSLKWSYAIGGNVFSSPAIGADGTIYVGTNYVDSNSDTLYALNPGGSLKWSYNTGHAVLSSPAIGVDGTVYVGSANNNLYAINPDGSLKWYYTTGNCIWSSPSIGADGTVYVGSFDNKLYALNPDGSLKWSYTTGGDVYPCPAISANGTVYVGSDDSNLYALNPDGSLKWSYTTGDHVRVSPAIGADGTVYVGSHDGKLYALNPDGSLKWSYTGAAASPVIGADGTVYLGGADNKLYAFGP